MCFRPVAVEDERRPVEDQFVLPAGAVEIGKGQTNLRHPCARDFRRAIIILVDLIGAAVHCENEFSSFGLEVCADRGKPDILANRNADRHALEQDRIGQWPRRKVALFIESAIVGQFMLVPHGCDGAAVEQYHRVIERVAFTDQRADNHRRAAIAGRARQAVQLDRGLCRERRFFDHVLRRVADQMHLRKNDQVDVARFGPFAQHGIGIAAEVADALRHLGECDLQMVGHSPSLARLRRLGNARTRQFTRETKGVAPR